MPTMPSPCRHCKVVVHWGSEDSSKCSFRPLWTLGRFVGYLVAMFACSWVSTAVMEVAEAWRVEEKALASAAEATTSADAVASLRSAALAIEIACSLLAWLSYAFYATEWAYAFYATAWAFLAIFLVAREENLCCNCGAQHGWCFAKASCSYCKARVRRHVEEHPVSCASCNVVFDSGEGHPLKCSPRRSRTQISWIVAYLVAANALLAAASLASSVALAWGVSELKAEASSEAPSEAASEAAEEALSALASISAAIYSLIAWTHTAEEPHRCDCSDTCSKAFSTSSSLFVHTRTHTKILFGSAPCALAFAAIVFFWLAIAAAWDPFHCKGRCCNCAVERGWIFDKSSCIQCLTRAWGGQQRPAEEPVRAHAQEIPSLARIQNAGQGARLVRQDQVGAAPNPPADQAEEFERECVVCLSEPRQTRFGCGHSVVCTGCFETLLGRESCCPTCREPVRRDQVQWGSQIALQETFVPPPGRER